MNYWVFTVKDRKGAGESLTAEQILRQRLSDKFWGLGEKTPNRGAIRRGDRIVCYAGLPVAAFVACTSLASDSFALSDEQRNLYDHGMALYHVDYGVHLDDASLWDAPHPARDLIGSLKFIENKAFRG